MIRAVQKLAALQEEEHGIGLLSGQKDLEDFHDAISIDAPSIELSDLAMKTPRRPQATEALAGPGNAGRHQT